jgi:hypothetical protein
VVVARRRRAASCLAERGEQDDLGRACRYSGAPRIIYAGSERAARAVSPVRPSSRASSSLCTEDAAVVVLFGPEAPLVERAAIRGPQRRVT